MNNEPVHFSTMIAASIKTDDRIEDVNPDTEYTNVTRFDKNAAESFCKKHKSYDPLKIAIGSLLGDYICIRK